MSTYIKLKDVSTSTTCLVNAEHITQVVPPNPNTQTHCHLFFHNGQRVVVNHGLQDLQTLLEGLGHKVVDVHDALKPTPKQEKK